MKTVGIIGGLGPETTSEFYLELIFQSQRLDRTNRPPILIYSVPITYKAEENEILKGLLNQSEYKKLLVNAAKRLEQGGADFLVMSCNSLDFLIDEIRSSVKIPVLSVIEEAIKFLEKKGVSRVGLISTLITRKYGLYEGPLAAHGITTVVPSNSQQTKINKVVLNLTLNRYSDKDKRKIIAIVNDFEKKGVEHVILACTDLQLLIPQHPRLKIYDTMKIFADATVQEILSD